MNHFEYRNGEMFAEGVALKRIAKEVGTPAYVYCLATLKRHFNVFDQAFARVPHIVCFSVKANSNLALLHAFAKAGGGFDIVSGGELARVQAAGGLASRTVFSGVGKTADEMAAALAADILCFNVESAAELETLAGVAAREGRRARVSFRVNPDVDPGTHPYISTGLKENKFGVPIAEALALYRYAAELPSIAVTGIDMHIGSQITELAPYRDAAGKVLALADTLAREGVLLEHVDLGGGLGVRYRDEQPVPLIDYAQMVRRLMDGRREKLILEPGRRLVADAGVLLTRVLYLKSGPERGFAIVDAAMNDLLRPALYEAWHAIDAVRPRVAAPARWDIVGPVCESADFLGHDRMLALAQGDLLAVRTAGAYGMSMSSNYNARPRACELVVDGASVHIARRRERIDDLFSAESRLP